MLALLEKGQNILDRGMVFFLVMVVGERSYITPKKKCVFIYNLYTKKKKKKWLVKSTYFRSTLN